MITFFVSKCLNDPELILGVVWVANQLTWLFLKYSIYWIIPPFLDFFTRMHLYKYVNTWRLFDVIAEFYSSIKLKKKGIDLYI